MATSSSMLWRCKTNARGLDSNFAPNHDDNVAFRRLLRRIRVAYSHIYLERSGARCFFIDDLTALTSVTQQLLFQLDFFAAFAGPIIDSVASKQLTKKELRQGKTTSTKNSIENFARNPKNCPQG
jgi:hypothetical protein